MKSDSKRPLIAAKRAECAVNEILCAEPGDTVASYRDALEAIVRNAIIADRVAQRRRAERGLKLHGVA
jgi:hypothetical protein